MAVKTKDSEHASSPARHVAGWVRQGIESFMASQKILLDLTAQQNALVIGMVRERLSEPLRADLAIAKIVDKSVQNLSAAGKILLDLAGGETELVVDGVKEAVPLPAPAGNVANLLRHRLTTLIDLQKRLLEAAAEQTHEAVESYQDGKLMDAGARAVELARQGLENLVETEKKFLDLAVHEVNAATKSDGKEHKAAPDRYKILTQLVRDGGEKYMHAQKEMLNLAVDQMESAGKTVGNRLESARSEALTSWSKLAEKIVHNFATAQKSLMDLVATPAKAKTTPIDRKRKAHPVRPKAAIEHVAEKKSA